MRRIYTVCAGLLITLWTAFAGAGDLIKCTECGMQSELASKFTARTIEGGKELYFCDTGDMLSYLNKKKQAAIRSEVKDYPTGAWIDAGKAHFVQAPKKFNSPMGWGLGSFKDKKDASAYGAVLDLTGAMKAVR